MKKNQRMKKDVVAGLGEIGKPILKILTRNSIIVGFDLNHDLMNEKNLKNIKITKPHFCM